MGCRAKKTMTLQIPRSYGTHKIAFFMHGVICGAANIQLIGAKNVSDLWTPRLTMGRPVLKEVGFASTLLGKESFLNEVNTSNIQSMLVRVHK